MFNGIINTAHIWEVCLENKCFNFLVYIIDFTIYQGVFASKYFALYFVLYSCIYTYILEYLLEFLFALCGCDNQKDHFQDFSAYLNTCKPVGPEEIPAELLKNGTDKLKKLVCKKRRQPRKLDSSLDNAYIYEGKQSGLPMENSERDSTLRKQFK